jgi:prepilin-type N-terminal cleavage/methylation domain-containing protein
MQSVRKRRIGQGGFTLVEVLVVAAIMVLVIGLTIGVARSVRSNARRNVTESIMSALENAVDEFFAVTKRYPAMDVERQIDRSQDPPVVTWSWSQCKFNFDPDKAEWSCYTFQLMKEIERVPQAKAALAAIPEKYIYRYQDVDLNPDVGDSDQPVPALAVLDGWGRRIQYFTINERQEMMATLDMVKPGDHKMWIPTTSDPTRSTASAPTWMWMQMPERAYDDPSVPQARRTSMPRPNTPKPVFFSAGPDGAFGYYPRGSNDDDPDVIEARKDNLYSTGQPPPHDPSRVSGAETLLRWWEGGATSGGGGGAGGAVGRGEPFKGGPFY